MENREIGRGEYMNTIGAATLPVLGVLEGFIATHKRSVSERTLKRLPNNSNVAKYFALN